jgi:hypothetical protein
MKKFLLLCSITLMIAASVAIPNTSNAQLVTTLAPTAADDTLTNADTAYIYISTGVGSNSSAITEASAVSVRAHLKKLSGTAAGSIALQGNTSTGDWTQISAGTFTNTTSQVFDYSLRNSVGQLQYVQYRLVFITSGTVSAVPKAYLLRRN